MTNADSGISPDVKGTAASGGPQAEAPVAAPQVRPFIAPFARLSGGFWTKDKRMLAWFLTIGMFIMILFNLAITVGFNSWNKYFFDALEAKDGPVVLYSVGLVLGLALLSAVCSVIWLHFKMRLHLHWREWVTSRLISRWLGDRRFYQMTIAEGQANHPEFRIADDVRMATEPVIDYGISLTSAILNGVTFVSILWIVGGGISVSGYNIPGYLVIAALVYAGVTTVATILVGRPLVKAAKLKNTSEAQFRYELTRIRESAETIALLGGDESERARLNETFEQLAKRWVRVIVHQGRITWISNTNYSLAAIIPLLLCAPKYLSGEMSLGTVMQAAAAFTLVQGALSFFVDNAIGIAEWMASARRVVELNDTFDDLDSSLGASSLEPSLDIGESPDENIHLENLNIATPDGTVMIDGAESIISPGEKVLVKGSSGSGKSTMIRAMAGLWPWGSGKILWPKGSSFVFVPQRPYMPLGTFRDLVRYPDTATEYTEQQIIDVLSRCDLSHFSDRLDDTENWDQTLSGGEKQRVAFARLLLAKPSIIVMDEATSALDEAGQRQLLELFRSDLASATIINVAHRPGLEHYHDGEINLLREGGRPATATEHRYTAVENILQRFLLKR